MRVLGLKFSHFTLTVICFLIHYPLWAGQYQCFHVLDNTAFPLSDINLLDYVHIVRMDPGPSGLSLVLEDSFTGELGEVRQLKAEIPLAPEKRVLLSGTESAPFSILSGKTSQDIATVESLRELRLSITHWRFIVHKDFGYGILFEFQEPQKMKIFSCSEQSDFGLHQQARKMFFAEAGAKTFADLGVQAPEPSRSSMESDLLFMTHAASDSSTLSGVLAKISELEAALKACEQELHDEDDPEFKDAIQKKCKALQELIDAWRGLAADLESARVIEDALFLDVHQNPILVLDPIQEDRFQLIPQAQFLVLFRFFKETPELLFNQRVLTRDDLQSLTVFGVMALGAWSLFKRSPMGLGLTAAGIGGSVQASDRLSEICGAYENRSNVIQLVREASIEQQMQAVHDCPLLATSLYGWYLDAQPID